MNEVSSAMAMPKTPSNPWLPVWSEQRLGSVEGEERYSFAIRTVQDGSTRTLLSGTAEPSSGLGRYGPVAFAMIDDALYTFRNDNGSFALWRVVPDLGFEGVPGCEVDSTDPLDLTSPHQLVALSAQGSGVWIAAFVYGHGAENSLLLGYCAVDGSESMFERRPFPEDLEADIKGAAWRDERLYYPRYYAGNELLSLALGDTEPIEHAVPEGWTALPKHPHRTGSVFLVSRWLVREYHEPILVGSYNESTGDLVPHAALSFWDSVVYADGHLMWITSATRGYEIQALELAPAQ